jgi:hypothetical protein
MIQAETVKHFLRNAFDVNLQWQIMAKSRLCTYVGLAAMFFICTNNKVLRGWGHPSNTFLIQ